MSEFPDPDFSALRGGVAAKTRQLGRDLETDAAGFKAAGHDLDAQLGGDRATSGIEGMMAGAQRLDGTSTRAHQAASDADALAAIADRWESAARGARDADIDEADAKVDETSRAMSAAYRYGTPVQQATTSAAANAAQQNANSLRQQRIDADTAYNTATNTLTAKVNSRVADHTGGFGKQAPGTNSFGTLKPPASAPRITTPAPPRTAPAPAPRNPSAEDAITKLMAQPQGQPVAIPGQPQQGQQPHPAAAGGAPAAGGATPSPSATGARPSDKRRDSSGDSPAGLAAGAVTGAGAAAAVHPAAARPATTGGSVTGMTTPTNVTGRAAPELRLSGGTATNPAATAAGTSPAGTGGMPQPMGGPMGGAPGRGAAKDRATVVQSPEQAELNGINAQGEAVRGGTILRRDQEAPPEQKAS